MSGAVIRAGIHAMPESFAGAASRQFRERRFVEDRSVLGAWPSNGNVLRMTARRVPLPSRPGFGASRRTSPPHQVATKASTSSSDADTRRSIEDAEASSCSISSYLGRRSRRRDPRTVRRRRDLRARVRSTSAAGHWGRVSRQRTSTFAVCRPQAARLNHRPGVPRPTAANSQASVLSE